MFIYTENENEITSFANVNDLTSEQIEIYKSLGFKLTEREIFATHDNKFLFKDNAPQSLIQNEIELQNKNAMEQEMQNEIYSLKNKLNETDYIVTKIAEGVATKEEYKEILKQRSLWRKRINELQGVNKNEYSKKFKLYRL